MRRIIQNGDDEAQGSCGANFPAVSRSAAGEPAILVSSMPERRHMGSEDASDLDEGVSSLGSLAVKLIAEFSLPRCQMLLRRMEPRG